MKITPSNKSVPINLKAGSKNYINILTEQIVASAKTPLALLNVDKKITNLMETKKTLNFITCNRLSR